MRVLSRCRDALGLVSRTGWVVLAVAVLLGVVGHDRGWPELTVPAATLGGALLCAVLLTVGRSTYAVDLDLSGNRVTVGQRATGRIAVRNVSRRRLLPAGIELPVGRGAADFPLPFLGPGAVHEEVFAVPTTRRAVVVVGPVRSVRGDPLGLLRRRLRWTEPVDLYVHPEVVPLGGATAGVLRDLEGRTTRALSDSDLSFHALRDYVAGDDRRHIHWKTSARIGDLMVRQFEDTRRSHTAVVLSTALDDFRSEAEFELAVASAASIGVQTLRDQRTLTFLAGPCALRTDGVPVLLDDTARLERTAAGPGCDRSALRVAREVPDASVAVLVGGTGADVARLRASTARIPAGVQTVLLVCAEGGEPEVARHGAVSVARIGALADLPRVLRRVVTG
jgi:hypothetical protein